MILLNMCMFSLKFFYYICVPENVPSSNSKFEVLQIYALKLAAKRKNSNLICK